MTDQARPTTVDESAPAQDVPDPGIPWGPVIRTGLIGAADAIYACLVGIVPVFHERPMVQGIISLGQTFMVLILFGTGYLAARGRPRAAPAIAAGAVGGLLAGAGVSLLVVVGEFVDLRAVFKPASPALYDVITFELGLPGFWIPAAVGLLLGAIAGGLALLPVA